MHALKFPTKHLILIFLYNFFRFSFSMIPIRLPHAFPVRFLHYSAAYFSVLPSFSPRDFPRFVFLFTGKPKRAATANADRACLCFYSVSHRDNFCKRKMRPRFSPTKNGRKRFFEIASFRFLCFCPFRFIPQTA